MGVPTFNLEDVFPTVVVYESSGEWSALYVNGELKRAGDHPLIDEAIRELFGVTTIQSDDFLVGGDGSGRNGNPPVPQTLAQVEAYTADREARERTAATLRAEAAALLAQATALDGKKS